jgi:hypothetical protein
MKSSLIVDRGMDYVFACANKWFPQNPALAVLSFVFCVLIVLALLFTHIAHPPPPDSDE